MSFESKQAIAEGTEDLCSLFVIRGNLDGEAESQDYIEKQQFIGLTVGKEEFLLPISTVIDINMLLPVTFVPHAPKFVDGVINLRGIILPAINLRKILGLPKTDPTPAARIIIVKVDDIEVGLLVDGITYVVNLTPSEIETQSFVAISRGTELISSIGKTGERVLGILDPGKIVQIVGEGKLNKDTQADQEQAA
jgi:purine-binding chemotaxis protein CheW